MLPILDDHSHLSPLGRGVEAVREFQRAGGTHLIVSHMPYGLEPIRNKDDWLREFGITCNLIEEARRKTEVSVFCVVGPYPVELIELSDQLGLEGATQLMKEGVIAASKLVEEQKAIGIGEVGRPHFSVEATVWERSNEILRFCMETAKDIDCPIVLHTEAANERNLKEFSQMASEAGMRPERVIKHYCGRIGPGWETGDLALSILATMENVTSAIRQELDFMMESDYLDDIDRPGAVLSSRTVPRRTKQLFQKGIITEELWHRIHVERPRISYGIDTESR